MRIQKLNSNTQVKTNTLKKYNNESEDKVILGSTIETPDFLKIKNLAREKSGATGAVIGGAGLGLLSGVIGSIEGGICAAIGLGAKTFFGPMGGNAATAVIGIGGFLSGCSRGGVLGGAVKGASCAASTWVGSNYGFPIGLVYGGAITGIPSALMGGLIGATAGAMI